MELLKLLSANELIAQALNFLVLLVILRVFLWKRFLKILDGRRDGIAKEYRSIEDTKQEIENLKRSYEERMGAMEERARAVTEEAVSQGKKVADTIIEEAERSAEKMVEDARQTIKSDLQKARQELKDDIVGLTISVAEKVIEERLTEDADKKLINGFLDDMAKKR